MTEAVSTRISGETLEKLDEIVEEQHLERASLLRNMLEEDVEEYLKEKAVESYSKGEKSIESAARQAEIPVWEIIDHVQKNNDTPPKDTIQELEKEYSESV